MSLIDNPEFRRNLWLEMSPLRLAVTTVLSAIVLFAVLRMVEESKLFVRLASLGLLGFSVMMLWGGVNARNALAEEYSEGTWDGQRMSAVSPWQMTWGKLFGATLVAWYGGAIFLGILVFALMGQGTSGADIFVVMVCLVSIALITHAIAMMTPLLHRQKSSAKTGAGSSAAMLLLFALFVYMPLFNYVSLDRWTNMESLWWWGVTWSKHFFIGASLVALAVWAVAGGWLFMRREMLRRNPPGVWLFCQIFWIFWLLGFCESFGEASKVLAVTAFGLLLSGYTLLFFGRKDQGVWLRLVAVWKKQDWKRLGDFAPAWLPSVLLALLCCVAAFVLKLIDISVPVFPALQPTLLFTLGWLGLVVRDFAWILWLNLAPNPRHPDGAALLSLFFAYGVLPFLFPGDWSLLFYPPMFGDHGLLLMSRRAFDTDQMPFYALCVIPQAAFMLWLLYQRLKSERIFIKGSGA